MFAKFIAKTPEELTLMRASAKILKAAQDALKATIQPGSCLMDLDELAEDVIKREGGIPAFKGFQGFPATLCTMINNEVVHGIPDTRKLKYGDIFSVDCGAIYKGWYSDAAFTVIVGGDKAHPKRAQFSQTVYDSLQAGCRAAKAGNTLGDIGYAIQTIVEEGGYSLCKEFTGHGLGRTLHEDPNVFNYGEPHTGAKLIEGMTICIEPIVASRSPKCRTLSDGWTVVTADGHDACQWEHCGVVTKDGLEIFA